MNPIITGTCAGRRGTIERFIFFSEPVQLRLAAAQATTPAAYETRKREVEKRLGVSDADLREYVSAHGSDVKLLSAAWDSVEARVGRANFPDTANRPGRQPPPAQATPTRGQPAGARPMPSPPPGRRAPPKLFLRFCARTPQGAWAAARARRTAGAEPLPGARAAQARLTILRVRGAVGRDEPSPARGRCRSHKARSAAPRRFPARAPAAPRRLFPFPRACGLPLHLR